VSYCSGSHMLTFTHLTSASRKRRNGPIYTRLLYKSEDVPPRQERRTFFHMAVQSHSHVDRNGQEGNEWKKKGK